MNTEQTMHKVTIDEATEVYDNEQNRVTRTDRGERYNKRIAGTSKLACVLKAFATLPKTAITDNLEVRVDNAPFPG